MGIDVYKRVADRIIEIMNQGRIPWERPYNVSVLARSHQSGEPYSLLNQMILDEGGNYWTFQQAKKEGYSIKKGAKAKQIYFYKLLAPTCDSDNDDEEVAHGHVIPYLTYYNVFHERDVDGLELPNAELVETRNKEENVNCDAIFNKYINIANLKVQVRDGVPCYSPSEDIIRIPQKAQFISLEHYYATLFHEMIHSTGHRERLNRDLTGRFGSQKYAREELVAEMGSAFLCCNAKIDNPEITKNKAAYIQNWSGKIKNDPRMFVFAASRAEAAVRFILGENVQEITR